MQLARNPRTWLLAEMLGVLLLASVTGLWQGAHELVDSASYREASRLAPVDMLRSHRTIGYPLLLKAVALVSPDYRLVPLVHLLAHLAAVFFFDGALRRYGFSPWQALAASSGLVWMVVNDQTVTMLLTDSLGRTAAIVAVSFLLWVSATPRRAGPWIGLVLSVAAAYHVRPVYLILVPLVPCLGLIVRRLHLAWQEQSTAWFRYTAGLAAAAGLPLVGFCLLRLVVVGHFGLVSFGGYNTVGIAAELLDPMLAAELPASLRPLAQEILHEREARQMPSAVADGNVNIRQWTENYNVSIWQIAYPAAVRLYGRDPVTINRMLTRLSHEVLWAKKALYLRFVRYNLGESLGALVASNRVLKACLLLAVSLFVLRAILTPRADAAVTLSPGLPVEVLAWVGLTFAAANVLLIVLVETMVDRYAQAAGQFLPAVFSLLACGEARKIWLGWGRTEDRKTVEQ